MILVTGSTGNVGREVVNQLAASGRKVRALVRDLEERTRFPTTIDVVKGDLDHIESLVQAMQGAERVYLVTPLTPSLIKHDANVIEAARRAKVRHVVKQSVFGAPQEGFTLARWHRAGEKALEISGLGWTHLRPAGFYTNTLWWAPTIRSQATVFQSTGEGKVASIDPRAVAAVAVKTLTETGHESRAYELTGPTGLSASEQCALLARVLGKPIKFVNVPDQAARDTLLSSGMHAQVVDVMLELFAQVRAGRTAQVTDVVQKLTGKPARAFEAWVREHRAAFH
jgi:uncharacterized protein YbjT (DUF2867 family)